MRSPFFELGFRQKPGESGSDDETDRAVSVGFHALRLFWFGHFRVSRRSWLANVGEMRIAPVVALIVTVVASAGFVGFTYYLFPGTTGSHGYVSG